MLKQDRSDVSGEMDFSRLNGSCECGICDYGSFVKLLFRFQYVLKKVQKLLLTSTCKIYTLK